MEDSMLKQSLLKVRLVIFAGLILLVNIFYISCGNGIKGYAVILWSPDEEVFSTGEIIPIYGESDLRNTYSLSKEKTENLIEVQKWRIRFFKNENDAVKYLESFYEYSLLFADVNLDGLPIRETADSNAKKIYRLRENQSIKILERVPQKVQIGSYEDYWYNVLTDDGVDGYCFGAYLKIRNVNEAITIEESSERKLLNEILSRIFRPESYYGMITTNQIDLEKFSVGFGLFPNPADNNIVLSISDHTIQFNYTDIQQNGNSRFIFKDTSLEIEIASERKIAIRYEYEGKEHSKTFVFIEDIDEIINSEIERRVELYNEFLKKGDTLTSSAYGIITLTSENSFVWENYDKLTPSVIPTGSAQNGRISFLIFTGTRLQQNYNGVISFHFNNSPNEEFIHFLYTFSGDGVKLINIRDSEIINGSIENEPATPNILFFTITGDNL